MKLSLLVSLLVLATLLYEAQGIRLGKVSISTSSHQIQKEGSLMERSTANGGTGKPITCKDENCSGGILTRKLVSKPPSSTSTSTSTTTTNSKNHTDDANKDGHALPKAKLGSEGLIAGKEAYLSVSPSSPFTKYWEVTPEQYPDIIDIAGMDYSPARRIPPIHN